MTGKYEIVIESVFDSSRPVITYRARVYRVSYVNNVKILEFIGRPDMDFVDQPDKEKVLAVALNIVNNDK